MKYKKHIILFISIVFLLVSAFVYYHLTQPKASKLYIYDQEPPTFGYREDQIKYYSSEDEYSNKMYYYIFKNESPIFKMISDSSFVLHSEIPLVYFKGYIFYPEFSLSGRYSYINKLLVKNRKTSIVVYKAPEKEHIATYALSKDGRYLAVQLLQISDECWPSQSRYVVVDLQKGLVIKEYERGEGRCVSHIFSFNNTSSGFYVKLYEYEGPAPKLTIYYPVTKGKYCENENPVNELFYSVVKDEDQIWESKKYKTNYTNPFIKETNEGQFIPNLLSPDNFIFNSDKLLFLYQGADISEKQVLDFVFQYDLSKNKYDIFPIYNRGFVYSPAIIGKNIYFISKDSNSDKTKNYYDLFLLDKENKDITNILNAPFRGNEMSNIYLIGDAEHNSIWVKYLGKSKESGPDYHSKIARLDLAANRWSVFDLNGIFANLKTGFYHPAYAIDDNSMWFYQGYNLYGADLFNYSYDTGKWKNYSKDINDAASKEGISLTSAIASTKNYLYFISSEYSQNTIVLYNKITKKWEFYNNKNNNLAWNIYKTEIKKFKPKNMLLLEDKLVSIFYYYFKNGGILSFNDLDKVYLYGDRFIAIRNGEIYIEDIISGKIKQLKLPFFKSVFNSIITSFDDSIIMLDGKGRLVSYNLNDHNFKVFYDFKKALNKVDNTCSKSRKSYYVLGNKLYLTGSSYGYGDMDSSYWALDLIDGKFIKLKDRCEYRASKYVYQNGQLYLYASTFNNTAEKYLVKDSKLIPAGAAKPFSLPYDLGDDANRKKLITFVVNNKIVALFDKGMLIKDKAK